MFESPYTEEDRIKFVALAQELGSPIKALEELGYPTKPTAYKWCRQMGLKEKVHNIRHMAKLRQEVYSDLEQLEVLSQALDVIYDKLSQPKALKPHDIQKLSSSAQTVIETMRLIDNKPNSITQRMDQVDGEIQQLISKFKNKQGSKGPAQAAVPTNTHLLSELEGHE